MTCLCCTKKDLHEKIEGYKTGKKKDDKDNK